MNVRKLKKILQKLNPDDELKMIQEEELECMSEWWDDEKNEVSGNATKIYSEDLYSHETYLLAIDN